MTDTVWFNFAVALGLGLLIGLERERSKGEGPFRRPAGIRTFALSALGGALAVHIDGVVLLSTVAAATAVTQLASTDGDIAATLGGHARLIGADLVVMGAYGHAKIIEVVLGGVTRSMIFEPPIPVFMSC